MGSNIQAVCSSVVWIGSLCLGAGISVHAEHVTGPKDFPVRIASGFECSMRHPIEAQGGSGATNDPARFVLRFPKGREQSGFFMFALEGVAGKTVQVTIQSDRAGNWTTLNPVFAYVDEQPAAGQARKHSPVDELLANPDLFRVSPSARTNKQDLVKAPNGTLLPDTRGQPWSIIEQCSADPKKKTFSLRQTFDAARGNRVVIAMRYPYTPKLATPRCGRSSNAGRRNASFFRNYRDVTQLFGAG